MVIIRIQQQQCHHLIRSPFKQWIRRIQVNKSQKQDSLLFILPSKRLTIKTLTGLLTYNSSLNRRVYFLKQKRKNERIKEIQYNYTNSFTNYLWISHIGKKQAFILLNHKDLISIHDQLPEEIQILFKRILNQKPFPFQNDLKPDLQVINDFMNFWPHWHLRIREIIHLQIESNEKIQSCFQSEYSFASRILANLKLNFRVQKFCSQIFEGVIQELQNLPQELIVDFSGIYERWTQALAKLPQLKRFIEGGQGEAKNLKGQIEVLFGRLKGDQQAQVLIQEMIHFQRKQKSIEFLLSEVGEEQVHEGLNLRLSWLVWKKILANRKKLQLLATSLLSCLIESYQRIPHQIKFVVRCFKEEAQKKYGILRYEDLKSFFNKVMFSQLFFSQFMSLYQNKTSLSPNTNMTLLALVSQKIMFGQQFYEKYKFGFLNSVITHYVPTIKQFILGFSSDSIQAPPRKFMNVMLSSFESLRFMYDILKDEIRPLPGLEIAVFNTSCHQIAGKSYPLKSIFVCLVEKIAFNYISILKPNHKVQRTMIQFLLMIDKISEKKSLKTLIEQYRCSVEDSQFNRPSVQLYAIYLEEVLTPVTLPAAIEQIQSAIEAGKKKIQTNKIGLEQQANYSANLEKMFMSLLNLRRVLYSKLKLQAQINCLINSPLGFEYQIEGGKICEGGATSKSDKTFKRCLQDISQSFLHNREGVDGLYHIYCERMIEELEKGVLPDHMAQNVKNILGQKLYSMLKLDIFMSEKDYQLFKTMEKHQFVTLTMLDLPQYQQQEQLILRESQRLIANLSKPCCPDKILKIFLQLTLIFQNVILITGSATDITADVQIPMMLVSVIRSKIKNIITLLDFVQKFCSQDINSSVLGQTLTLMKSVVYLIAELDHTKLNMSEQEYQKKMLSSNFVIIQ